MQTYKAKISEGTTVKLLARVTGPDGQPIKQADAQSVTVIVTDASMPAATLAQWTADVSTTIYDTLHTDATWTTDDQGYNVAATIPGDQLNDPTVSVYQVAVTIAAAIGDPSTTLFRLYTG